MSIDGQPIDWTKVELRTENMTPKEIKYWKRFKKCVEQTNKDVEKLMQGYDPPPFPLYEEERARGWCDRQDWERKQAAAFPFGPIPHWIKCEDRLPQSGVHVLAYSSFEDGCMLEAQYIGEGQWEHDARPLYYVTHWMPLPPPPSE